MKNLSKVIGIASAGIIVCVAPACVASAYDTDTVYTTDYLRVREAPGLDANIIDVVAPGTAIQRISKLDNGWSEVIYNDCVRYMSSDYLVAADEDKDYTNGHEQEHYFEENIENVFYQFDYDEDTDLNDIIRPEDFYYDGVEFFGDYRWTYYSERVLPGGGLDIPGRHTDSDGYICDEDDNICLASDFLPKGTVVATPFGKDGKVYDCGCGDNITLDVYVNW